MNQLTSRIHAQIIHTVHAVPPNDWEPSYNSTDENQLTRNEKQLTMHIKRMTILNVQFNFEIYHHCLKPSLMCACFVWLLS